MAIDIEARIKRLLDQLEQPNLPEDEIARIKEKVLLLRELQKS
jgi:hypothetical protein